MFGAAVCVASLVGGSGVAGAAAPPPTWTGLYIGAHLGGSAAALPVDYSDMTHWDGFGFIGPEFGAFAGLNWQFVPGWVIGAEIDGTRLNLHNIDIDKTRYASIRWMTTIDARFGRLITPNTLLYGKVGWGRIGVDIPDTAFPGTGLRAVSAVEAGFGVETALAAGLRGRVEAVYTRAIAPYSISMSGRSPLGFEFKPEILSARVGLIYALEGGGSANEMPAPGPAEWSGLYAGAQGGWSIADVREEYLAGMLNGTSWDAFGASGGNFGAFVGVNQQVGNSAVVGVELAGTRVGLRNFDSLQGLLWGQIDWLASLDVRAGVLVEPRTLFYVKGGAAVMNFTSYYPNFLTDQSVSRATLWGYQGGVGIETQITPHWSARVEGLYTAALKGLEFDDVPPVQNHSFRPQIISGEIGVAYRY